MYFGMFGSIFFLSQFLQNVLHNTPLQAGEKLWCGRSDDRRLAGGGVPRALGSRPFMVAGLSLQAIALGWIASMTSISESYAAWSMPFIWPGGHGARVRPLG